MSTKLVFVATAKCLGASLIMGALILQSACTPAQTTPPVVSQTACTPAQTAPPVISQTGEAGASSIETVTPITMAVEPALTPQEVERPSGGSPKLGSSLNQLLEAYRRGGLAEARTFAETHRMMLDDGRVQVEMVVAREAVSDLREAVEAMGGQYQGHHETLLQALVPLDALELLAQRPDVEVIREPRRAGP